MEPTLAPGAGGWISCPYAHNDFKDPVIKHIFSILWFKNSINLEKKDMVINLIGSLCNIYVY